MLHAEHYYLCFAHGPFVKISISPIVMTIFHDFYIMDDEMVRAMK